MQIEVTPSPTATGFFSSPGVNIASVDAPFSGLDIHHLIILTITRRNPLSIAYIPRVFVSSLELFRIGIGPSSSHTVGPMKAARRFALGLADKSITRISAELFGSLGATGKGHDTDKAIILGFHGESPDQIDPDRIPDILDRVANEKKLTLPGDDAPIHFDLSEDIRFNRRKSLPAHPNAMRFTAAGPDGQTVAESTYYSIGGGFILCGDEAEPTDVATREVPYPFSSGDELLELCDEHGISISQLMRRNECALIPESELRTKLAEIWAAMRACVDRGCHTEGILPGGLKVKRRAPGLYRKLSVKAPNAVNVDDPMITLDWIDLWALAVNEENAAGGRVVTAPTNGAAGIIPAVLHYATEIIGGATDVKIARFLLTAAAIGSLYKKNASISGADVGCQGEVGVACSMAAGALAEYQGGEPAQVENAAEIGMEHNLGLTCDPIGGLVQIPCIERNAMGAVKAINAARMAMRGDGQHFVSLDKVIRTMRETGKDMRSKYKETSRGGLAVNVTEC
ncbi:MAG: L-serine dehydratase [Verrucomicrobiales bacterium]